MRRLTEKYCKYYKSSELTFLSPKSLWPEWFHSSNKQYKLYTWNNLLNCTWVIMIWTAEAYLMLCDMFWNIYLEYVSICLNFQCLERMIDSYQMKDDILKLQRPQDMLRWNLRWKFWGEVRVDEHGKQSDRLLLLKELWWCMLITSVLP